MVVVVLLNTTFFFFLLIPSSSSHSYFSLSLPRRNSDPESLRRPLSPLPITVCAYFIEGRFQLSLPSSTRIDLCLYPRSSTKTRRRRISPFPTRPANDLSTPNSYSEACADGIRLFKGRQMDKKYRRLTSAGTFGDM